MPPDEAMQEGRRIVALVEKYHDQLCKSDIDPALLSSISTRAGAFSYCVAVMDSFVKISETNYKRYQTLKKEGYAVRAKILKIYEYVFRNDEPVLTTMKGIREGRGDLDMFRDNLSLYKFGDDHRERLIKANVDFTLIDRASYLYNELFNLTAQLDIDPKKIEESKRVYAKAWTYLSEAMKEIYLAGRIVFMDQPEIEELFYSDYWQKVAKRREENKTQQETESKEPVTA
jgi:hypothetical protein